MERRQQILALGKVIEAVFTSSEWVEIGLLTATDDYIDNHPRLLRSLNWGDNDYKGHVGSRKQLLVFRHRMEVRQAMMHMNVQRRGYIYALPCRWTIWILVGYNYLEIHSMNGQKSQTLYKQE